MVMSVVVMSVVVMGLVPGVAGALAEAQDEASGQGEVVSDVVRPPTMVERAKAARTAAELNDLWMEALRTRQATAEVVLAIKTRKAEILAETKAG